MSKIARLAKKGYNYIKYIKKGGMVEIYASISALTNYKVLEYYKRKYWIPLYGELDTSEDIESYQVKIPLHLHETGSMSGPIMKWSSELKIKNVLFAGDGNIVKTHLQEYFPPITTASISQDSDYFWDFEKELPKDIGTFDLIINQSCFEHLVNPYKHFEDMSKLLNPRGKIIIQTHVPGHAYHRYPIDALRYFPDWFEEVAKRLNLKVLKRRVDKTNIFYMFELKKKRKGKKE